MIRIIFGLLLLFISLFMFGFFLIQTYKCKKEHLNIKENVLTSELEQSSLLFGIVFLIISLFILLILPKIQKSNSSTDIDIGDSLFYIGKNTDSNIGSIFPNIDSYSYTKHGQEINLIMYDSVINIEDKVAELLEIDNNNVIYYLRLPCDIRTEDLEEINNIKIEYSPAIQIFKDYDISDWKTSYYAHNGLLIIEKTNNEPKYTAILPMESSPNKTIKHAGPPAIEINIDD